MGGERERDTVRVVSSIQTQHNDPRMVRAQSSPYGVTASIIMSPFKNPSSKTAMREKPAKFEPLSQRASFCEKFAKSTLQRIAIIVRKI